VNIASIDDTDREAQDDNDEAPEKPQATLADVDVLVKQGMKIDAIKKYREITGAGLKSAKDAIDGWSGY